MNHYPHHIGDYRRDTGHLSLLEHGIYRQLLDTYYLSEAPIPKETELVFRRLRAGSDAEQQAVMAVLREFFEDTERGWVHRRCEAEIARYRAKVETAKRNGINGGRPQKPTKTEPVISRNPPETGSKANQEPRTKNQGTPRAAVAAARPDDVPETVWTDFVAIRRAKRAPLTETALDGIRAEAAKAGVTLAEAIQHCCSRGWQGFKAEWMRGAAAGKKPNSDWRPPELRT